MSARRIAIVYPVPMPYTFPVLRLLHQSDEIELVVLYSRRILAARGDAPDPASFGFPHIFLADAGGVFVGRDVREIDLNLGLPRALGRFAPDLVVVSGFVQPSTLLGIGWAIARRRPYGLWVESHDMRPRGRAKRVLRRSLAAPLVSRASLLLPSGAAAADGLAALGGARSRMARFPHVPDPAIFHARDRGAAATAARRTLGVAEGTPLVASVSRLVETKGVRTLLEAHRDVHARTGAWLVVVGSGPLERELRAMDVPGVSFLGYLDPVDVASLLRGADVAVSAAHAEPWGTFPVEAAASGCPIVATTAVPSAAEIVVATGAGRLVPPGDADALATALTELLSDSALLAALSERAIGAARAYTPERVAASFLEGAGQALALSVSHRQR